MLVLTLLALLLLSSAVFFIFNVGVHLQKRTEAQNAADAAAAAGAGWVARTLNLVAMNHVEITRLMAQVQVLDAIPPAIGDSLLDHQAALDGVEVQLRRGGGTDPWLVPGLSEVASELRRQVVLLEELDAALITGPDDEIGFDVARMTFYDLSDGRGGSVRGSLWEAMLALDQISRTAMTEVGPIAQRAAVQAAVGNLGGDVSDFEVSVGPHGFLVPFVPELPWEAGDFTDFAGPLRDGLLPPGIDDDEFVRGPFDVIFGWRKYRVRPTDFGLPQSALALESDYPLPAFRRPGRQPERGEVIEYRNYGPYEFYVNQLGPAEEEALGNSALPERGGRRSWLAERAASGADWKANRLLETMGSALPEGRGRSIIPTPNWDDSFARRTDFVNAGGPAPDELFIYMEFSPTPEFGSTQPPVLEDWGFYPEDGPGRVIVSGLQKVADHVWRADRRLFEVNAATGERTVYVQHLYLVWCAAILQPAPAFAPRNPNNFTADDPLPLPIRLIEGELDHDDAQARAEHLRFFAVAEQPAPAPLWAALFDGADEDARPAQRVTATASATVFNTHSWDLWTQMWHAQLVPVENLRSWLNQMQRTGIVTEDIPYLDSVQIGRTFRYLEAVAPLLEVVGEVEDQ